MADTPICSVADCGKTVCNSRGWCNSHYLRWRRYGDPTKGRINHGDAKRFCAEVAIPHKGENCLIWPYFRDANGYGRMSNTPVHARVCEEVHGPRPSQQHQAAHSCGKGNMGCVSGGHVSWKTCSENQMDRVLHGTSNRGSRHGVSKLTEDDVRRIKAMQGKATHSEIAKEFGVTRSNISAIFTGVSWGWMS